ncbi:nitronate monooxygenase [Streptomyces sp. ACA25]|uniref:nitronate monooxygenase n=1 Tax=Streptomyces sp. ACA25 TaxID=3022596 RepID=UPI0023076414|nr:nitronate monooxygenase [Streptomyces sp. ACA25]MDB1088314.1 nitronate monooxygenase [Streptomyces sp. ACA25]
MPEERPAPAVIQGGMGIGVSGWRLAAAVARTGQLGVVSGVALDTTLARRLQRGDPGGDLRRALAHFPYPEVAERILRRYFVSGGIAPGRPFRPVPRLGLRPHRARDELTVAGNFTEVWLAREGHDGPVGINYLEKVQLATPAAAYGAMLAGVDYVLMGAGIPSEIPALLDALARHAPAELSVTVSGSEERHILTFDPVDRIGTPAGTRPGALPEPLRRPRMLAIVSSTVLATYLCRSPATRPDGFVLETPSAGGHSAPPRGRMRLSGTGEPVYGPRDALDLAGVARLGLPFWLAGGYGTPEGLAEARAAGATGIQAGTVFALCRESGLDPALRRQVRDRAALGTLTVLNAPDTSPAGFPFKVAGLPETLSEPDTYQERPRLCDLGYLRTPYLSPAGSVGYRCAAEPVDAYVRKGGAEQDTAGRRCLCNALTADIGLGQHRSDGYAEPALVTLGQDLSCLEGLPSDDCSAADVVAHLLGG